MPRARDVRARAPAGGGAPPVALVALIAASLLLALVWALVSPPFQAPDENSHFGYAQALAVDGLAARRPGPRAVLDRAGAGRQRLQRRPGGGLAA